MVTDALGPILAVIVTAASLSDNASWVVERSLGWLMLHRRLTRDYETLASSAEAMIHIAMIDNASKCITGETTPTWRGTYWGEKLKSNAL